MGNPAYPPPMPGPWGFLTSGYFVGLVVMVSCHSHVAYALSLCYVRRMSVKSDACLSQWVRIGTARDQWLSATFSSTSQQACFKLFGRVAWSFLHEKELADRVNHGERPPWRTPAETPCHQPTV